MKTLLIGEIHADTEKLLRQHTELQKITTEDFLKNPTYADVETVILRTFTPLQEKELQKLPALRTVVSCSVGLDNIAVEELQRKKIELIHCPGSNANSVAEHTLYFLFSLLRKQAPFPELKGKTIGILGLGYIGKLVARKLLGCGARVIAFDVIPIEPTLLKELQVEMKSWETVLQESDIVTVHVPLNKHTKELINEQAFQQMRDGTFFINTSRAEVVDETALLHHAAQGKFSGIALDMCSAIVQKDLRHQNLLITDHVAAQGQDSFREMCLQPVRLYLEKLQKRGVSSPPQ
ncbi:MAG: D-isomer specific 2-hydroxyacid dehydrogenase family protein [Nanoarchaeota archaeon]|nr:D-isomer specific 2-hydroxyacid dehydrogenase family protein [Nanoarchaeota archaeon]